ncbi:MAG: hypothetical protein AAF722_06710 [Cyanobacteria bacterium P01_C01_bin.70]
MRAMVAAIVPIERCGSALGLFYVGYSIAGQHRHGTVYDWTIAGLATFSIAAQIGAIAVLFWVSCQSAHPTNAGPKP